MDRKTKPPDLLFEHDWSTDSEDFVIQIWVLNSVSFSRLSNELITRKTNSTHVRDCPVLLHFHEGLSGFFPEAIYGTVGDFMSLLASIVVYILSTPCNYQVCLPDQLDRLSGQSLVTGNVESVKSLPYCKHGRRTTPEG